MSFDYSIIDENGATDLASVTIDVLDAPDNSPPTDLDLVGTSVDENAVNGTAVGTNVVTDPDVGDMFTYNLLSSAGGRFAVDASGNVTVADGTQLDHEANGSHDCGLCGLSSMLT